MKGYEDYSFSIWVAMKVDCYRFLRWFQSWYPTLSWVPPPRDLTPVLLTPTIEALVLVAHLGRWALIEGDTGPFGGDDDHSCWSVVTADRLPAAPTPGKRVTHLSDINCPPSKRSWSATPSSRAALQEGNGKHCLWRAGRAGGLVQTPTRGHCAWEEGVRCCKI